MNVIKAEQDAFYYAHHPKRLILKYNNIYEAIELGFINMKDLPIQYDVADIEVPEINIGNNTGENISGSYSHRNKLIKINPSNGGDEFTNFHEHLHWQRVGNAPIVLKDYYYYKVDQVLNTGKRNALSKPRELVIHGLTAGKILNILPFSKYPGNYKVLNLLPKLYKIDNWTINLRCETSTNLKNVWKILTGNYLY